MACRTTVVWMVGLGLHYLVDPTIPYSEAWTKYSYLQLVGFVVFVLGQTIYAGMPQVLGRNYCSSPEGMRDAI